MPGAHSSSSALSFPCRNIASRSVPYVISAGTRSTSIPPSCWKYVNWVISIPSSQTSQPSPQGPERRLPPVVLEEPRVVPGELDPERLERAPVLVEHIVGARLEDHLE